MVNTVTSAMNRPWETISASNNDKKELPALLKSKLQADQLAHSEPKRADRNSVATSEQGRLMASKMQFERAYQYSETMSLQLTTKEGDNVTLDFRQMYAEYQSYKQEQHGEQGANGVRHFESREAMEMTAFEERFAFSVEGDLNEEELAAIFDVFEQVDRLANDFFGGNLEDALQKAMALNIDYGQLESMSLNLTQTSVEVVRYQQEAMSQYQQVQNRDGEDNQTSNGSVADLPPYLQQWQSVIERLDEQFEQAQTVMNQLMAGVLEERFAQKEKPESSEQVQQVQAQGGWLERVKSFHEQLQEMAASAANKATDTASTELEEGQETEQTTDSTPLEK